MTKKSTVRMGQDTKVIAVKFHSENLDVLRHVLNANGIKFSTFLQNYVDSMADLVRACALTEKPIKEFTVLEFEELFARMQAMIGGAQDEARGLQQNVLPGCEKKAGNGI